MSNAEHLIRWLIQEYDSGADCIPDGLYQLAVKTLKEITNV